MTVASPWPTASLNAKTSPESVRSFVEAYREQLSGLSIREALKHL